MATYPLPTLAATVDASGISTPSYTDVLESLKAHARSIFGSDVYLEADSQDGQMLAIIARAIVDCNDMAVGTYNNMSPLTSQGEGLSSVVKINGIARQVATNSTVTVRLTGAVGTVVNNGKVRDQNGHTWKLPASCTIGSGGFVDVTATAEEKGAIIAGANTVNIIATPTAGWNSVTNSSAAVAGAPVESDAALRRRQTDSVALDGGTLLATMTGAVKAVSGVQHARVYENSTNSTDGDGIPAHHIAVVTFGGSNTAIADAIMDTRSPGVGMHGTTTVNRVDDVGVTQAIKFSIATQVIVKCNINLTALTGYTSDVGDKIKQALVDHFDSLPIGVDVYWGRCFAPALLPGDDQAGTFEINTLELARGAGAFAAADVAFAFNEIPRGALANVVITVV